MTKNPCYTAGRTIQVKGLMLHSVGCAQPSAQVFVKSWNKSTFQNACVHAFIDANTGDVYQTLPWNHRGWHCGSGKKGSANNTHIGIELCEPSTLRYTGGGASFTDANPALTKQSLLRTYNSAVELFAALCQQFRLNPLADGVILSHQEGHQRGMASAHIDPNHLWSNWGRTMDGFRRDVNTALCALKQGETSVKASGTEPPPSAASTAPPYLVRVTASALHIRKGPGTQYAVAGCIRQKEVYTVTAERDGWGKLKSGAGWIRLSYTRRV